MSERRSGWALMGASLRGERRAVTAGAVYGLVWTAAKVTVPLLATKAIDRGIIADDHGALLTYSLVLLGVGVVQGACTGLRRYTAIGAAARIETDLRQRLFAHLQRLHFAFHDRAQTGQLMSRANTDLQQIQFFLVFIPLAIANTLTVVAVAIVLLLINPLLALLALFALPFVNLAAKRFSASIHPVVNDLQQELAELGTVVEESVSGIRVVKGFGAEPVQARRLRKEADDVFDTSMLAARIRSTWLPVLDFLPAIGLVIVLWFGGHQVLDGKLTIGELVAFNAYVLMLVWPLRMTGMLIAQAQRSRAAAERVDEILATEPLVVDAADAVALPADGRGELRFDSVVFSYAPDGGGPEVLDGFDLHVRAGEAVAVVGATGSGKTTVARLIPRFYDVTSGSVSIDGVDVRRVRLDDLRRAVGIVFEDTFLFSATIRENIAFADPDAPMDAVERAARLAGAHDFVLRLPDGYDTVIGEHGFSLSGGQRQRVAIARAILADPRVLILDDATSSVDPTKEHEIRAALAEVMSGRTTIVIAHRPATIALADRVVVLDGGRVVAEGTHDDLLATSARYREILARAEEAGAHPPTDSHSQVEIGSENATEWEDARTGAGGAS
ncbi:MAG TPA: ABC transporter ATP-binding protein [Acidimicrobiales bacterium]|nr:ABC transporter ATP-binding protein [Acidimicrobiales bacterium]